MKVLIVGSGAQGTDIAAILLKDPVVTEIKLGDIDPNRIKEAEKALRSSKVKTFSLDASKVDEIVKNADGVKLVVNAVVPVFNLNIMEAAYRVGAHYLDMAFGPPYDARWIEDIYGQTERWEKANLTALTCTGGSPGVTNCLIARAAEQLDSVDEVHVKFGGRIKPGTKFLEGKQVISAGWSAETAWGDVAANPMIYENGEWKMVPHWYDEEIMDDIANTACHAHEEVLTIPRFIKGINYMDFKMAGPTVMVNKAILDLGLLDAAPIDVKGCKVAPRDLFFSLMPKTQTAEERAKKKDAETQLEIEQAGVTEVIGVKDGVKTRISYVNMPPSELEGLATGWASAGTYAAYIALQLLKEEIKTRGVIAPECLTREEREAYLDKLKEVGIFSRIERVERYLL